MRYMTHTPEETENLGERLSVSLRPGDVIAFFRDLGAGKTAFTRGLARGLGIDVPVTSPTYTIVNEYLSGRMQLFHFDMYRLGSSDELFDIVRREGGIDRRALVEGSEIPIFDKYDPYIPPTLLRNAYAEDRLRADEVEKRLYEMSQTERK